MALENCEELEINGEQALFTKSKRSGIDSNLLILNIGETRIRVKSSSNIGKQELLIITDNMQSFNKVI